MSRFPKASFAIPAILILIVCILAASQALRAWWVPDGVAVSSWYDRQSNPRACSDGMGGAIIVYEDMYGGVSDIACQRVSASGNIMWDFYGMNVCSAAGFQYHVVAIPDGAGGVIAAWQDERNGSFDIYVARINARGLNEWIEDGVPLCTDAQDQEDPCIIADGAGGAIVAWRDSRSGNDDIYAQRVNSVGTAVWTANGVALCTATGHQRAPQAESDRTGGAIVTWGDLRTGVYDIYAQRVDRYGVARWTANGVALCTATGDQYGQAIAADGAGGAIVAWRDQSSFDNVYAQRVNASGAVQWAANGVAVYATEDYQWAPHVVSDGAGGAIIAWYESRKGGKGMYAQRLNAAGVRVWTAGGVTMVDKLNELYDPWGSPDGSGGMILSWMDEIGEQFDLFARRVTPSGTFPWGPAPISLSTAIENQRDASIAPDGEGGAVIAWADERNGGSWESDIYAQLVDAAGRVGWIAPEIASVRDVPGDQGGKVFLSWDATRADRYMEEEMSYYSIWRSIDATQAALTVDGGASTIVSLAEFEPPAGDPVIRLEKAGAVTIYWELVDTQDALYMEGYAKLVATLFDSTAVCDNYHYFQVVAHTTDPKVFWKSAADSGWSIDNLPPCPPLGFEGEQSFSPIGLNLSWNANEESDFSRYALYRGLSPDFVPEAGNLIVQFGETSYFDGDWSWDAGYYYKLSAIDVNCNESEFAVLGPGWITDTEIPAAPEATSLSQNFPNPFNPMTRIDFALAASAAVRLRVYDAAGRLVRSLIDEDMPAGRYGETWDGRDTKGSIVASGVYFYRLDAGAFTETRKMVLLR